MAVIRRATNEKASDSRWGGNWRPSSSQVGYGLAGAGLLGGAAYLASKYPARATKWAQKGVKGAIRMIPEVVTGMNPANRVGQGLSSFFFPGSSGTQLSTLGQQLFT